MGGGGGKTPWTTKKTFFNQFKKNYQNLINHQALGGGGTLTLVVQPLKKLYFNVCFPL